MSYVEGIAIAVSVLTLIITTTALIVTIHHFKKQLQLNFFADYTKRYQEILLKFPEGINEAGFEISQQPDDVRERTLRYIRAYFDLCSEEYYLWKKGNLDGETWREWETGIRFAFSKPAFREAWQILSLDTIYYGEFSRFVEDATKTNT